MVIDDFREIITAQLAANRECLLADAAADWQLVITPRTMIPEDKVPMAYQIEDYLSFYSWIDLDLRCCDHSVDYMVVAIDAQDGSIVATNHVSRQQCKTSFNDPNLIKVLVAHAKLLVTHALARHQTAAPNSPS